MTIAYRNVEVTLLGSRYCLAWESFNNKARFHVWLERRDNGDLVIERGIGHPPATLYKNPPRHVDRHSPEHFRTRKLHADAAKNADMITAVMLYAKEHRLFEGADATVEEKAAAEHVAREQAIAATLVHNAAPKLFAALDAIYNQSHPRADYLGGPTTHYVVPKHLINAAREALEEAKGKIAIEIKI